ncbi:uncharacterized protein [Anoplolepis gracilipes]|uniref:uncharacterized protein n=1 Tax=Anoplolepis gracilipes TaxID=354296 RepID=UPI003BA3711B
MILAVLFSLVFSLGRDVTASPRVDEVIVRFIVNATPVLFAPSRLSLQLCIDYDDTIKLSRILSRNHLAHYIRNSYEKFNSRIYNNLEHRNLYVLDLNCDYASDVLRQADSKKMFVGPTKWLLLQNRRTLIDNDDNANLTSTYNDSILEIFEDLAVYPDSDVVLAKKFDNDFLQLTSVYRPSPQRGVIWEDRGNWTAENGLQMKTFDVASARRRNLQQTALKSALVITDPNTINHLTDFKHKSIDPVAKAGYPSVIHLANRMNATISFEITNTWGYRAKNGSWSGMIGMLDRREIDIGGTPSFLVPERLGVVQYIQLYTHTSARFVFRRPLLSSVSNIFILPFQQNVWIAIAVFLILVLCLLYLSIKWEYYRNRNTMSANNWKQLNPGKQTVSDNLLILLGAFSQQGYSYEPYRVSSRIVTLMLLLASLSLYAAYTANIVGLLQSTTDSIKTLPDLFNSPLKLGTQDIVYNRHYFKLVQDPVRKAIVEQRIEPKGRKSNWMSIEEGVSRIKNELFAFHGEIGALYEFMEDTYQEEEKCGLTEIDFLKVTYPLIVTQIQSPYLEIIKNGALILREYGLKYRAEYRLYTRKPVCSSKISFITIGFTECYFALVIMGYGILLAVIIFVLEFLWHKNCFMDIGVLKMFSIFLCILALSFDSMFAFSHRIDDVTVKFIIETMPILFPPSRISLHLCISYDNTIKLSRKLSNLYLMHGIHNDIPDFDPRIYNDLEHENLYVLDLDCNYATKMLRQLDLKRMFVAPMRWLLIQDRRTMIMDSDDDRNITFTPNDSILEIFEDLAVYPDSDVILAKRFDDDFFQLTSVYRPSPQRGVIWEDRGNWTVENSLQMKTFDVASARRRNLQQTTLKSAIVVLDPEDVNDLTGYKYNIIDTLMKVNYRWLLYLINRMSATLNLTFVSDWGNKDKNGSFNGLTELLSRREIDLGGTTMNILEDRIDEVKYIHLHANVKLSFVFRQPLLSTVTNIFILPFERDVWIAIAVFLVLVFCSLYASMKWEYYRHTMKKSSTTWKETNIGQPTFGDDFLVILGAFAQQGYSYEPFRITPRIITLTLLIASLNLYAAYTANIVALLQSPSDSIKTLSDLFNSPLTLGAEDIYYSHYVFKSLEDPIRKAIFEERIEPKGHKSNWMSTEEGVKRIKNGTFAFHALECKIFHIMQETYEEHEKCGLTEIHYLNLFPPHLPLPKQSPYLEIIKNGALILREYGLKQRDEYRFFTKKPKCSNQGSYISIGFTECQFVIVAMGYGMLLSLLVFVLELVWHKISNKNTIEEMIPTVIEKKGLADIEYID